MAEIDVGEELPLKVFCDICGNNLDENEPYVCYDETCVCDFCAKHLDLDELCRIFDLVKKLA